MTQFSQRGLDVMLGELASVQEDERLKNQMKDPKFRKQVMNQFSYGGTTICPRWTFGEEICWSW